MEEVYYSHNVYMAKIWAESRGTPDEVANELVVEWNRHPIGQPYPETPEFKTEVARLISLTRKNAEIIIVEDYAVDKHGEPLDRLCKVCMRCF